MSQDTPQKPYVDAELDAEYSARFFGCIPIGPWHGPEVIAEAEKQARLALEGKAALLGRHWDGVLYLDDKATMERFWSYLGRVR
jgi:hypothetical protein